MAQVPQACRRGALFRRHSTRTHMHWPCLHSAAPQQSELKAQPKRVGAMHVLQAPVEEGADELNSQT